MIRVKKSLGQNFLKSELALRKIIEAGEIKKGDVILEIGPGRGALTEKLLEVLSRPELGSRQRSGGVVIAVEKDRELFEFLKSKFGKEIESNTLILVCGDILSFEISEAILAFSNGLAGIGTSGLESAQRQIPKGPVKTSVPRSYKIVANIPYNITGAILKKFLTEKNQPERMVLMVQYDVAKRITTPLPSSTRRGGKESILSISVKAYGEPVMIMKVPARYFSPQPKVDSAIIVIKNISRKLFTSPQPSPYKGEGEEISEDKFWQIVKAGFAHKRKKLSSNLKTLKNYRGFPLVNLENKRAEDLSLADWIGLVKLIGTDS